MYVHADLHGASSVIIKNNSTDPIPPTTLHQAGTMSVVQSKAWDSKIITSAWWVNPSQVSKTAPSGEYLTTGSFMIRGKKVKSKADTNDKNFLPPVQLVYGFGLLFKVDETSIGRHFYERRPWARNQDSIGPESNQDTISKSVDIEESIDASVSSNSTSSAISSDKDENALQQEDLAGHEVAKESVDPEEDSSSIEMEDFPDTQIELSSIIPTSHVDKYNLSNMGEDSNDSVGADSPASKKKYISAKERRDMKKGKQDNDVPPSQSPAHNQSESKGEVGRESSPAIPVRGKKGKLKKIKEKYKDQDEEDRKLVSEFLGADQGPKPKGKRAKATWLKMKKEEEMKAKRELERNQAAENRSSNTNLNDETISQSDAREVKRMLEEENVALPDEDQIDDVTYLDTLTGEPHHSDILLHAVPVCAPWNALQKYKYKLKLTPGGLKKGKAAKSVLASFVSQAQKNAEDKREWELIKALQETEIVAQILGKVKISGLVDIKKKS